ncbi:MAG: histidine ammonia-lyase [Acidimicrobiales bacterium]
MTVVLRGTGLSFNDIVAVARGLDVVELSREARAVVDASHQSVERLAASGVPVYGVSTGFGSLATVYIDPGRRAELQRSLVRSHAAGMGEPVEIEVVRAMMLSRARSLSMGWSGVRAAVIEGLLQLLNHRITPVVPEHGSLGCSGDLAPLAHVALVLMGEGEVWIDGDRRPVAPALAAAGLAPVVLDVKEGLALINGTDGMLAMLVLAAVDAAQLLRTADLTAAMSIEALLGTDAVFVPELHRIRPHPGQQRSAANILRLLAGSAIVASHLHDDPRVQDAYSLRCAPQVHGAARDTLTFVEDVCRRELDSAIDNPMVLPDGRVSSNGNFHGAPLGYAADFLAIALADVGSMAERRTDRQLDARRSQGLPPFLAHDPGVDSGLMIAQYTAAALVAENKRLAAPASVDSIPTSAMQEDHVSMGWAAARKLRKVVNNLRAILAIEMTTAARAIELRAPLAPAPATKAAVGLLRASVPGAGPDRWLAPELETANELLASGAVVDAVNATIGPLQ